MTLVDNSYISVISPNQDLSEDILLISIDYHGLPPERVEVTPQPKVGKL